MPKILIIDDDKDILVVASMLLQMNDLDVATLDTGIRATQIAAGILPDLILVDVNLGDVDGREVCRDLKNSKSTCHIPVVLFSANHELDVSYTSCGADQVISRPFETLDFIKILRNHMENALCLH